MNSLLLNILVAVLILITCLAQLKTAAAQSSPPPPHIIYILADDLGCNTTSNNCLTESPGIMDGIVGLGFAIRKVIVQRIEVCEFFSQACKKTFQSFL
jgi:hypothetical protein